MTMKIKVGDIICIPLEDGRYGYCQYVYDDSGEGPLIQVYKAVGDKNISVDDILSSGYLFGPVITGLFAAILNNVWRVIGYRKVENFKFPKFRATNGDPSNVNSLWFIYDGKKEYRISPLPEECYDYEYLTVWSPYDVADRIVTLKNPYLLIEREKGSDLHI